MSNVGNWIEWTGADDAEVAAAKIRSIRRLVLLTLAAEAWRALRFIPYSSHTEAFGLAAAGMTGCAIVGWTDRWSRQAVVVAFVILFVVVAAVFPENANHQFLALVLLALIALSMSAPDQVDADRRTALQSMRWIAIGGLAWAGIMKLLYGVWFEGEFLAYRIARDPDFAFALGWILPEPELARLIGLGKEVGAGPFRVQSIPLIMISNLTWIAELLLPIGLLLPRTRKAALVASVLFVGAIEVGAREFFFGAMMIGLLLLFATRDRLGPLLPIFGLGYAFWLGERFLY